MSNITPINESTFGSESEPDDLNHLQYSLRMENIKVPPGFGAVRRNLVSFDGLVSGSEDGCKSICEAFELSVEKFGDSPFLGARPVDDAGVAGPFQFLTYKQASDRVRNLAVGISKLGIKSNSNVGIYSANRVEWVLVEYACFYNCLVTVPLYDTLGDQAIKFICHQTDMEVVFAANDRALNLLKMRASQKTDGSNSPTNQIGLEIIKQIFIMDGQPSESLVALASEVGVSVKPMEELETQGSLISDFNFTEQPTADSIFTICYTSGTTGNPKGVMLTHRAFLAGTSAVKLISRDGPTGSRQICELGQSVVHLSYLPLPHIYERLVVTALMTLGAKIGFWQRINERLIDDVAALQPTVFISVPRILTRIVDGIKARLRDGNFVKRTIFDFAYRQKVNALRTRGELRHWIWDRFVFGTVRALLGGHVKAILTGSAPVSPDTLEFIRVCFGCEVYEGYGQTETCAASSLTIINDWSVGHVGVPTPCNEFSLLSVPEMGYYSSLDEVEAGTAGLGEKGRHSTVTSEGGSESNFMCSTKSGEKKVKREQGEVCIRGANCFVGYYKEPEMTKEAITEDGWVRTGDIGEWDEQGRLRIIDRKKNIFKLSQGEYVSAERIENVLCKSQYVAQIFVDGHSTESALVAVVVPEMSAVRRYLSGRKESSKVKPDSELIDHTDARENGINLSDEEICALPEVNELFLREFSSFGSRAGGSGELKGFEIPRQVMVEKIPFSVQNGLLTPTFKLRRQDARKYYASAITDMYVVFNKKTTAMPS